MERAAGFELSKEKSSNVTVSFGGLWLLLFVCLKLAGTKLTAWSWWWLLLPIVPLLTELIKNLL